MGPDGVSVTHTAEDHGCITTCYLAEHKQQHIAAADAIRTIYEQEIQMHVKIDTTMHYALVNQSNVKMSHRRFVA